MANQPIEVDRRSFLSTAAGVASVSLAGCVGDELGEDGGPFELTVTQGQEATTLDPHDHRETSTRSVLLQTYERLLFRDGRGEIAARLATDWERVEPGEYRFEIREGVQFHEGESLTAGDCAYSIRRVVDSETHIASPQAGQLAGITGAEARSETDLRVFSDGFNPLVVASLASYCPIVNEEWTESRDPSDVAVEANGTGPFRITDYEQGERVEFEAFDDYWGDQPDVDAGTMRSASESSTRVNSLLSDETDVVTNVPPQEVSRIEEGSATNVAAVPSTRNLFVVLNDRTEPFDSTAFRRAVNYAVDLDSIIENVLATFGEPTGQPTIEGSVGYADDVEPYPYDPDRAADLVEESGYAGAEFTIHTPAGRYLRDAEVAQAVAGFVDDLPNVTCEVQQRDFGSLIGEITDGDQSTSPEAFLIGSSNPSRDASQKFNSWLLPGANTSHVSDETFTELYGEAQSEQDPERRAELLADINRRAHDRASLLFLHRQYSVYGVSDRANWTPREDELILLEEFERATE
ncbi:MAG: ABC transporter substrate-binding protein [Halobacteriales archaeon]